MSLKLTPKQEKFCQVFIETGNASEAYRQAYNAENMKDSTINRNACEVLGNNKITTRLDKLNEQHQKRHNINVDSLTSKYMTIYHLHYKDNPGPAKGALDSLAKLHGFMIERGVINHTGQIKHDHEHKPVSDTVRFIENVIREGESGTLTQSLPH